MEGNFRNLRQMNYLKDLTTGLPGKTTAILVRSDGRVVLCAGAVRLLGEDVRRVQFKTDNGKVFVGRSTDPNFGYLCRRRCNEIIIRNVRLAKALAEALAGYGDYRIEDDNSVLVYPGVEYYRIFQKNYNK